MIKGVSPLMALLKYGVLKMSGAEAYWFLQYRAGENKINKKWGGNNSLQNPLILKLDRITELNFPKVLGYNMFNPSIACQGENVLISWRISDNIVKPFTDSHGRSLYPISGFRGGIGIGSSNKNQIFKDGAIHNSKVLIQPDFDHRLEEHQIRDIFGRQVEFDDPRFVPENPNLIVLNGRYLPHSLDSNKPNFSPYLLNISENKLKKIEVPFMGRYEKNWVPLSLSFRHLRLLRSTQPVSIVELNLLNSSTQETIIEQNNNSGYHNGSNVILLANGFYIRIVRERIHIKGLRAIHFSTFMLHDLDMKLILQTKPFILQKYGFEICNSITQIEDEILLAWGDNDEAAFLGSIKTDKILAWIFENAA